MPDDSQSWANYPFIWLMKLSRKKKADNWQLNFVFLKAGRHQAEAASICDLTDSGSWWNGMYLLLRRDLVRKGIKTLKHGPICSVHAEPLRCVSLRQIGDTCSNWFKRKIRPYRTLCKLLTGTITRRAVMLLHPEKALPAASTAMRNIYRLCVALSIFFTIWSAGWRPGLICLNLCTQMLPLSTKFAFDLIEESELTVALDLLRQHRPKNSPGAGPGRADRRLGLQAQLIFCSATNEQTRNWIWCNLETYERMFPGKRNWLNLYTSNIVKGTL